MKLLALLTPPSRTPGPDGQSPFQKAQATVAQVLGATQAEAGMRLSAEPPALLAMLPEAEVDTKVAELRAAGFPAVGCPLPVPLDGRVVARTLSLEPDAVTFTDRAGQSLTIPYGEVLAILRGQQMTRVMSETTQKVKQFSMTRAVITQGLSFSKTTERTVRAEAEEVTHFVRVYARGGGWVSVEDGQMAFACLGTDLQPTKLGNIQKIVERLRERAPGAYFDDRLLRLGRRSLPFSLAAPNTLREGKTATARTDTTSSVDVIAHLLLEGLREGLL
jgi:hypothetical protein